MNIYSVQCESTAPVSGSVVDMVHPCTYPAIASNIVTHKATCPFHMKGNRNGIERYRF